MTILEQSDFKDSQVFILCLLKETYESLFGSKTTRLETNYPTLFSNITNILRDSGTDISKLSFRKIFEITKERNKKEELSFMLNILRDDLKALLKEFGFELFEDLEMEFRPKDMPDPKDLKIAELENELAMYKIKDYATKQSV